MQPLAARVVFGVVGLAMLGGAVALALGTRRFVAQAVRTEGVVVATTFGGSHPQVAYTTADGGARQFGGGGLIFGYRLHDRVAVAYTAGEAGSARVDTAGSLWFLPGVFGVLGAVFVFVSLARS